MLFEEIKFVGVDNVRAHKHHTSLKMLICPESLDSMTQSILNNNKTGGI